MKNIFQVEFSLERCPHCPTFRQVEAPADRKRHFRAGGNPKNTHRDARLRGHDEKKM